MSSLRTGGRLTIEEMKGVKEVEEAAVVVAVEMVVLVVVVGVVEQAVRGNCAPTPTSPNTSRPVRHL